MNRSKPIIVRLENYTFEFKNSCLHDSKSTLISKWIHLDVTLYLKYQAVKPLPFRSDV